MAHVSSQIRNRAAQRRAVRSESVRRRTLRPVAAAFVFAAAPAVAQEVPPDEISDLALRVCVRASPDASDAVRAPGFRLADRLGRTSVYVHEAGPTMRLTARPGFFACEIRVPDAAPTYLDALLADLGPEIQKRFEFVDVASVEDGMLWGITTAEDVVVTVEASRAETGTVSIVASADAAPLTAPTQ